MLNKVLVYSHWRIIREFQSPQPVYEEIFRYKHVYKTLV